MNAAIASTPVPSNRPGRVPDHTCPSCGMPAPAAVVVLPSGRRALIEACAICGRQEATPISSEPTGPQSAAAAPTKGVC